MWHWRRKLTQSLMLCSYITDHHTTLKHLEQAATDVRSNREKNRSGRSLYKTKYHKCRCLRSNGRRSRCYTQVAQPSSMLHFFKIVVYPDSFIWNYKAQRVFKQHLCKSKTHGGLPLPHFLHWVIPSVFGAFWTS